MRISAAFVAVCAIPLHLATAFDARASSDNANSNWQPVESPKLVSVSVIDANTVYGISLDNGLLRRSGDSWTSVPTQGLSFVQVAGYAEVLYAVDADGKLLRRSGDSWLGVDPPPPGEVWSIAVDAETTELAALTSEGLFRRSGDTWLHIEAPELVSFALSRDNDYWGVDLDGRLLRRTGDVWEAVDAPSLELVAAGGGEVFGIGGNNVFRRSDNGWGFVRGPRMVEISVGSDGRAWAVGPTLNAHNVWEFVGQE